MNENNQQHIPTTPTHSWGVITETDSGFKGDPEQSKLMKAAPVTEGCVVVARAVLNKLGIDDGVIDAIARPFTPTAQTAPVQEPDLAKSYREELDKLSQRNYELRMENAELKNTPPAAPVQPVASLKEADVLMMAEAHGIDPCTKGLYEFYIDCISSQPAAQPTTEESLAVQPTPVQTPITEEMHTAAVKVLHRANGVDGLPQRMLDAMLAAQPAAQRPWVGLTDERVRQLCGSVPSMKAAVREAEAELKEKNT